MLMLGASEGAYANAALFIALARKLIVKEIISKEEMFGIFDDANTRKVCCEPALRRMTCSCKEWYKHYRNSGR
jgi:hypothetical protein